MNRPSRPALGHPRAAELPAAPSRMVSCAAKSATYLEMNRTKYRGNMEEYCYSAVDKALDTSGI